MRSWPVLFLIGMLTGNVATAADPLSKRTPEQVVDHHIAALLKGDSTALIEDYAADAVIVFATRVLNGKQEIAEMFAAVQRHPATDDDAVMKIESVTRDVVVEAYTHSGPNGVTVSGKDVFVVRHGRIVFHATQATDTKSTR